MIEKAKHLSIEIDKDSNHLWKHVFDKIILSDLSLNRSSLDVIIDIIQNLMSCQEEIDWKENTIDNQHDLPIYLTSCIETLLITIVQSKEDLEAMFNMFSKQFIWNVLL